MLHILFALFHECHDHLVSAQHQGLSRILIMPHELIHAVVTHYKWYTFVIASYCACDGLQGPVTFDEWCIGVTISL